MLVFINVSQINIMEKYKLSLKYGVRARCVCYKLYVHFIKFAFDTVREMTEVVLVPHTFEAP